MLRIELRNVKPGMTLALPVVNPRATAQTLLKVGYALSEEIIDKLKQFNIRSVWVRYPSLARLEEIINLEGVQTQNDVVHQVGNAFDTMQNQSAAKLDYHAYTNTITNMVQHLVINPQSAMFLGDLAQADDPLLKHSANVTYLALLLGMKLEGYIVRERRHINPARAKELVNLGLGAMLHDIGITDLPAEMRQAYEATGDDQSPAFREHPAIGFRIVRGKVAASAAAVVLHHHQCYDGTGYVGSDFAVLSEKRIHIFGRIGAVAACFNHLREPARGQSLPTVQVLRQMISPPMITRFDPQVLKALLYVVPPYAPGSMVQLNDGRWAVSIDHHPDDPCRPTVSIIDGPNQIESDNSEPGETVKLTEHRNLHVVQHESHNVSGFNFETPRLLRQVMLNSA